MRIVLDTNILVSGILSAAGPPGQLLDAWLDGQFELITSAPLMDELARVLQYPKIAKRLSPDEVASLLRNLQLATLVEPVDGVEASPDPEDDMILATAIAGDADFIVTGDKRDLLDLTAYDGIPIITAHNALTRLHAT